MGEKTIQQPLTAFDKFTVFLYRSGIVIATACILYAIYFFYLNSAEATPNEYFIGRIPAIVFWVFVISVNMSVIFLHLYSKQILQAIRLATQAGSVILMILAVTGNLDYASLFQSSGWTGKVGVIGLGLVLAGFSGIGAKEAFCFKLYEGYAYGICLAILVLLQLFGALSAKNGFIFSLIPGILILVFTLRKLTLPLHYDIGDKSRY